MGSGGCNLSHPDFFLKLKPLSSITDEHAIEVAKILGFTVHYSENGKAFLKELFKDRMTFNFHPLKVLLICQYLQSQGYDLPNYHLNGQTLKQAGIACYE